MDPFRFGKRRVNVQPRRGDKVTGVKFRGSFRNSGALLYRTNIQDLSRFVDKKFQVVINWQGELQSDDYFSPSVFFFQIPDSLRDFTQLEAPVDDRFYLSGLHEVVHDAQVFFARSRQERNQLLTHEP